METCHECGKNISKYRCPTCQLQHCSVDCYKQHKFQHDGLDLSIDAPIIPSPERDSVCFKANPDATPEQYEVSTATLLSSKEFQHLLERYHSLREELHTIYRSTLNPCLDATEQESVRHGGLEGRKGQGRKGYAGRGGRSHMRPTESKHTWRQEQGFKNALFRIKKCRSMSGIRGEGFREFTMLVASMCDRNRDAVIVKQDLDAN